MSNPENIERAFFQVDGSTDKVEVHFNPETLQYTITNNLQNQGGGNATKQYVSDSTGKLTMDLIFDNTSSGEDIRMKSSKIAKLMEPVGAESEKAPPVVFPRQWTRNHSRDLPHCHFVYQETPWSRDPRLRRIVVCATSPEPTTQRSSGRPRGRSGPVARRPWRSLPSPVPVACPAGRSCTP